MAPVVTTNGPTLAERKQLTELRAEALKVADWIADNRATGHSNLKINQKKLDELLKSNESLLKKDPNFRKTLLRDIEQAKSPESRIVAEATKLAQWVSFDRQQHNVAQAAYNEQQLGALLERHAEFFAANPLAAKRIATAVERARSSVSKERTLTATTSSAALPDDVQKQAHALSDELGYAQAKGDKQGEKQLKEQLTALQQQHTTTITSYGASQFESELATSRQAGMERWLTGEKDAATIQNSLHLVGSDKQTIFSLLQQRAGESPEAYKSRLDTLKEVHQHAYGRSLEGDLRYYLQGASEERAAALLRGDKLGARFFQLIEARGALSDDITSIQEAYQGLTQPEIQALNTRIDAHWKKEYGTSYNHRLATSVGLSTQEFRSIEAARQGDELGVVIHNLRDAQGAIFGRETKVNTILERYRGDMTNFRFRYAEEIHNTKDESALKTDLQQNLKAGDQQNRAVANAEGKFADADAYRLRDAIKSGEQREIDTVLQGKTLNERREIEAAYKKLPGGSEIRQDIQALSVEEAANTLALLDSPADRAELAREALFRRAVTGWNVDEAGMVAALQGMSKAEAWSFRERYKKTHGADPLTLVEKHLSGDERYEALESLRGAPESRDEAIFRAKALSEYRGSGLLSGVVHSLSNGLGENSEKKLRALETEQDPELFRLRFEQFSTADKAFLQSRQSTIQHAGTIASVAGVAVATTLTGGAAAPLVFAAASLSSFAARAGIKYLLTGHGYARNELLLDAAYSALDGGFAFVKPVPWALTGLAAGGERTVLGGVLKGALREASQGGAFGALQGALDVDWQDPRAALQGVVLAAGVGAFTEGVGGPLARGVSPRLFNKLYDDVGEVLQTTEARFAAKLQASNLTDTERQALAATAAREMVAQFQKRLSTHLEAVPNAFVDGVTKGALSGIATLPSGMSFEEVVASLIFQGGLYGGLGAAGAIGAKHSVPLPELTLPKRPSAAPVGQQDNVIQFPGSRTNNKAPLGLSPDAGKTRSDDLRFDPAARLSNSGDVVYVSQGTLESIYTQRRVEELRKDPSYQGKPVESLRAIAEQEAKQVQAFTDTTTQQIFVPAVDVRTLSFEERIYYGAKIVHELAHLDSLRRGESTSGPDFELKAYRAMQEYLNKHGLELNLSSSDGQLYRRPAADTPPRPLADDEIRRHIARVSGGERLAAAAAAGEPHGGYSLVIGMALQQKKVNEPLMLRYGMGLGAYQNRALLNLRKVENPLLTVTPLANGWYAVRPEAEIPAFAYDGQSWKPIIGPTLIPSGTPIHIVDDIVELAGYRREFKLPQNKLYKAYQQQVAQRIAGLSEGQTIKIGLNDLPQGISTNDPDVILANQRYIETISREHLSITRTRTGYLVEDLKKDVKYVGVYARQEGQPFKRIQSDTDWKVELRPGAEIRLGAFDPTFVLPE